VVVTEQVRRTRPQPDGADRGAGVRHARPPSRGVQARPLVAAAVVLVMWFAWLLVPDPARRDLLGGPEPLPTWTDPVGQVGEGGVDDAGAQADRGRDGAAGPAVPQAEEQAEQPAERDGSPQGGSEPGAEPAQQAAAAPEVPQRGDGTFAVAPGSSDPVGSGGLVRYSVEVEGGVPLDPAQVAETVDAVLADPRSWSGSGRWTLQRTDADPDVRIVVTSPDTTDDLCAPLRTNGQVSCRNGGNVVLNALRWTEGASSWGDDVAGYRQYLVNHELGHFLGFGHVPCPGPGQPAPVMLQQTLGLQGCTANAWPDP
jgi:hypothetical protein